MVPSVAVANNTPHTWPIINGCAQVRCSTIEGAGLGLFAANTIAEGVVVATQQDPTLKVVTPDKDEAALQKDVRGNGCPDDAIVFFVPHRGPVVGFWDREVISDYLSDTTRTPLWYRMNHPGPNDSPNVKLVHKSGKLLWVTQSIISTGDELFWSYGMTRFGIGGEDTTDE